MMFTKKAIIILLISFPLSAMKRGPKKPKVYSYDYHDVELNGGKPTQEMKKAVLPHPSFKFKNTPPRKKNNSIYLLLNAVPATEEKTGTEVIDEYIATAAYQRMLTTFINLEKIIITSSDRIE